jgi:hypothetical protein
MFNFYTNFVEFPVRSTVKNADGPTSIPWLNFLTWWNRVAPFIFAAETVKKAFKFR